MALQVWLPLNGNLNNQGLTDITVTNSGATVDNNGKIGKCYAFNGKYISFNRPLPDPCSAFTVCGWVKLSTGYATNNGLHLISFETSYGRICISKDGLAVRVLLNYGGASSATGSNATDSSISENVWNHYAVTFDSGKINIYINGQLDNSYTIGISQVSITSSILKVGTYSSEASKGCVNDFRLYDHALSPREIELLSRGLVCHYPLNGGGRGGDNIISGTSPNEVQYTYPSSSYLDKFAKTSTIIPSASQYVLSFWAKSTHAGDKVRAHWYSPNTTTKAESNQGSIGTSADGQIDFTLSNKWEKYWCVWTQSSTTAVKHFIFPRMFSQASGGATGTGTVSVKCVKLEEGNIPTPWMPNSADSAYSAMGYNSTTEYDVSGYGYNGTKNGTMTYSSDTARYSVSTKFASTTYIETPSPCSNVRSASFWIKTDKTAYAVAWADAKSKLAFGIVSSGDILVSCNSGATKKYPNSVIAANVWQHIVIVRGEDIANTDLYVNGVKQTPGTSTDFWTHTSDSLIINGRGYSTPSRMNSQMSDFRLYATALSEDDIKELYNTAVSVANNGTLLGYELVEV